MCFKLEIIFIYVAIITIIQLPQLKGSRSCDKLEEKVNLSDAKKQQLNLEQCGGIHGIDAPSHISGGREKAKRYEITQVSHIDSALFRKNHLYSTFFE